MIQIRVTVVCIMMQLYAVMSSLIIRCLNRFFFLQSSALYNFYIWIPLSWLCHSFTVFYFLWTQRSGVSFKTVLLKFFHFTLKAKYHFLSIHPEKELIYSHLPVWTPPICQVPGWGVNGYMQENTVSYWLTNRGL